MLRIRLSATDEARAEVIDRLGRLEGVKRVTSDRNDFDQDWVINADLSPHATDLVLDELTELGVPDDDYVIVRQEVVAPRREPGSSLNPDLGFAWAEVLGEARANARPVGRYVALMLVAGCIAATGVITDNPILIVGAMAVSPDLLPICATSVALVGRRFKLAGRSFATLLIGMMLVMLIAGVVAFLLKLFGFLDGSAQSYLGGLGGLVKPDYSTVIISLAAGIAAILTFETRAATAVGVAISITTVPASAYFGVAVGLGAAGTGVDALVTLGMNVVLITLAGTITLWIQRRIGSPNH